MPAKYIPKLTRLSGMSTRRCPECRGERLVCGGVFVKHWRPYPRNGEICPYQGKAARNSGKTS